MRIAILRQAFCSNTCLLSARNQESDVKEVKLMGDGIFGGWNSSEVLFFILIFLCLFYNRGYYGGCDKC